MADGGSRTGGPGIAAGIPSFADFDDGTDYEGDDEDLMRDPLVQVDMQVRPPVARPRAVCVRMLMQTAPPPGACALVPP